MARAAHDPEFAKRIGIPVQTAKEWHAADQARRDKLGKLAAVYGPRKRSV